MSLETLFDRPGLDRQLETMADAIAARIEDPNQVALVGIRTRGMVLAQRLQGLLEQRHNWKLPLGILDITLYRDDLSQLAANPLVRRTQIDFDINGKLVFLIDDVLYTGRTIRSAIDEILDFGRPRAIRLMILVDRGGREFPIQPDFAALTRPTDVEHQVKVYLNEVDGEEGVVVTPRPAQTTK